MTTTDPWVWILHYELDRYYNVHNSSSIEWLHGIIIMYIILYFCSIVNLWLKVHDLWPRSISSSHIIGRLVVTGVGGACSCSGCGYSYCWQWGRSVHVKHFSINAALVRDHQTSSCRTHAAKYKIKRTVLGEHWVRQNSPLLILTKFWQSKWCAHIL